MRRGWFGPGSGVTPRALGLGLALSVVHAAWVTYEELALAHIGAPTLFALVQTVVAALFGLLAVNGALKRWRPAAVLTPVELLTIFVLMTNSVVLCASKFLQYLFPVVLLPFYRPGETGGDATAATLPAFFAPRDPAIVQPFFLGTREPWFFLRPEIVRAWAAPVGFWSVFVLVLLWTLFCLSSLLRLQWVERERLPFPIVDLPVLMATSGDLSGLFRSRALAFGFAATFALLSLNYVASLYPTVPGLRLSEFDVGTAYVTNPPWSVVSPLLTVWWPYAVGLCFLIPLEVSRSGWLVFLLIRLATVALTALGLRDMASAHDAQRFPWFGNLTEGAWLGMFGAIVWSARPFLRQLGAVLSGRAPDPSDEALGYRTAFWGALAGMACLVGAAVAAGMRLPTALLAIGLYVVAVTVMARMYAQIALPFFAMAFFSFTSWTATLVGTATLTGAEKTTLTGFYWFDRTYEQLQNGHHLEALALTGRVALTRRAVFGLITLASLAGLAVAMFCLLQIFYERGAATARVSSDPMWLAGAAWARKLGWDAVPKPTDPAALVRTAASAGIVFLLAAASRRWAGFPLHPLGYLLAVSFALEWGLWNVVFVTWLIKALVLRYGGLHLYRQVAPFFLGLALGDAVAHGVWGIGLSLAGVGGASPY